MASSPVLSINLPRNLHRPTQDTIPLLANNERSFAEHPVLSLLDRCSNTLQLKQIHAHMLRIGLFFDPYPASKLIQASALEQLSSLQYAQKVFDQIPHPNLYSWNALIRSYASSPEKINSILMFVRLLCESDELPDKFTYPFVIKASAEVLDRKIGKALHGMVIKSGFSSDLFVTNSLIHFYAECGDLEMAYGVFLAMHEKDVVSWNTIIVGFAKEGRADEALEFFYEMQKENYRPSDITLMGVFSACGKKMDLEFGRWLHSNLKTFGIRESLMLHNTVLDMYIKCESIEDAEILFNKMGEKDVISWTTVLNGYAKVGDFDAAKGVFDTMPYRDIATWNALIIGYERNGYAKEALATFNMLQLNSEAKPDSTTLVSALSACAQLGAMEIGAWIHVYINKQGMNINRHLATALIDMYSKSGDVLKALDVFYSIESRDVYVWSSMIAGLAMYGHGRYAMTLFLKMQCANVKPNGVTFMNILCACSHSALVDYGTKIFNQMESVYGIVPGVEHYACLVDILGRAGHLKKAMGVIENMPISPGPAVWAALLGGCRLHKNLDLAEIACCHLLELEPRNHGAYVLLSNIYAKSGKWDRVSMVRTHMREVELTKEPGCSLIEVDGVVHEFLVGETSHPLSEKIYSKLKEIMRRLKTAGFISSKSELLQIVEEEEEDMQDKALHLHSEKLAIAFGLISVSSSSHMIRVVKNLRVCGDCHAFAKLISKLYDKEILLRDRYRFHHFKDGHCSCKDYW